MQLTLTVGPIEVRRALESAEAVGVDRLGRALNAPLDGTLLGQLDEAWAAIKAGVLSVVRRGSNAVDQVSAEVWNAVNELLSSAGSKAQSLEDTLLSKLRSYSDELQRSILARIPDAVTVGSRALPLQSVQITQQVQIQGSLKASITEMLAMSAEGTIQVSVVYGSR